MTTYTLMSSQAYKSREMPSPRSVSTSPGVSCGVMYENVPGTCRKAKYEGRLAKNKPTASTLTPTQPILATTSHTPCRWTSEPELLRASGLPPVFVSLEYRCIDTPG